MLITGARDVLFSTPGARIAGLVVSGDGRTLYATTASLPGDVVRFDLDTNTTLASLPRQTLCCTQDVVWVRNRGVPALITNKLEVFNLTTNQASAIVDVPPKSGIDSNVVLYWYIATTRDDAEFWTFHATNASGCSSGQSNVLRDSQYLNSPEAMTFVADGPFLLVERGYLPTAGSLHLFRLPD